MNALELVRGTCDHSLSSAYPNAFVEIFESKVFTWSSPFWGLVFAKMGLFIGRSVCRSIGKHIDRSIQMSICMSIGMSIWMPIWMTIWMPIWMTIGTSICVSVRNVDSAWFERAHRWCPTIWNHLEPFRGTFDCKWNLAGKHYRRSARWFSDKMNDWCGSIRQANAFEFELKLELFLEELLRRLVCYHVLRSRTNECIKRRKSKAEEEFLR